MTSVLLISGCQSGEPQEPDHVAEKVAPAPSQSVSLPTPQITPSAAEAPGAGEGSATICQRELAALAKINPSTYAAKKAAFETLLNNASTYSAVRGDINGQTRDTLDALYKYKTQKLSVLNNHGEVRIVVPPQLAYGEEGRLPDIPPDSTMVYDIKIVDVTAGIVQPTPAAK